jgi:hypothetical protein
MRHLRLSYGLAVVFLLLGLAACQPSVTPTSDPNITAVIPTQASADLNITATDMGNGAGLPIGASNSYSLTLNAAAGTSPSDVVWSTQSVPAGMSADIVGGASPFQRRLIVTSDDTVAAGSYSLAVTATVDANQFARATVNVTIAACTETASGSDTKDINSNLVELITAGKPAVEHGLLVPVQICAPKHLSVKLTSTKADDGSTMTTPPAFYVFRSQVWPAPTNIIANGLDEILNVQAPSIAQANGDQLDADLQPGLYLLIFEHDRFGVTLTPQSTPANVTYDLKIS